MISVIIPSYRNAKYLDLCLKSITENKVLAKTEVIVVLDGFYDESKEVVDKYDGISVIPLESNMGMQYALNVGVMFANNPYVFIVNDDNVFPERWDERLEEVVNTIGDGKWVLTVNQIEPEGPSMFNFNIADAGKTVETFNNILFNDVDKKFSLGRVDETGGVFPFVIEKKYYMAVGGFDSFYDSPNYCDWDFFLKLELLDFDFLRTHHLHLYHFGSVATKKNAERQKFVEREQSAGHTYVFKWGAYPHNKPGTNSKLPPDGKFRGFNV